MEQAGIGEVGVGGGGGASHWDPHAVSAQVAETKDALAVCNDNDRNLDLGPIGDDLRGGTKFSKGSGCRRKQTRWVGKQGGWRGGTKVEASGGWVSGRVGVKYGCNASSILDGEIKAAGLLEDETILLARLADRWGVCSEG